VDEKDIGLVGVRPHERAVAVGADAARAEDDRAAAQPARLALHAEEAVAEVEPRS
jgi:hypothetical protein